MPKNDAVGELIMQRKSRKLIGKIIIRLLVVVAVVVLVFFISNFKLTLKPI